MERQAAADCGFLLCILRTLVALTMLSGAMTIGLILFNTDASISVADTGYE
jgi:hypothetical protein